MRSRTLITTKYSARRGAEKIGQFIISAYTNKAYEEALKHADKHPDVPLELNSRVASISGQRTAKLDVDIRENFDYFHVEEIIKQLFMDKVKLVRIEYIEKYILNLPEAPPSQSISPEAVRAPKQRRVPHSKS